MITEDGLRDAMAEFAAKPVGGLRPAVVRERSKAIRRRRWLAIGGSIAGAAAVTAVVFGASESPPLSRAPVGPAAHSQTPQGQVHPSGIERWQASIAPYVSRLLKAASSEANFTGGRYLNGQHAFVVQGVGQPTAAVVAVMNQAPDGVSVSWQRVPFTAAQLDNAQQAAGLYPLVVESDWWGQYARGILVKVHPDGHTTKPQARAAVQALVRNGVTVKVIFGPNEVTAL